MRTLKRPPRLQPVASSSKATAEGIAFFERAASPALASTAVSLQAALSPNDSGSDGRSSSQLHPARPSTSPPSHGGNGRPRSQPFSARTHGVQGSEKPRPHTSAGLHPLSARLIPDEGMPRKFLSERSWLIHRLGLPDPIYGPATSPAPHSSKHHVCSRGEGAKSAMPATSPGCIGGVGVVQAQDRLFNLLAKESWAVDDAPEPVLEDDSQSQYHHFIHGYVTATSKRPSRQRFLQDAFMDIAGVDYDDSYLRDIGKVDDPDDHYNFFASCVSPADQACASMDDNDRRLHSARMQYLALRMPLKSWHEKGPKGGAKLEGQTDLYAWPGGGLSAAGIAKKQSKEDGSGAHRQSALEDSEKGSSDEEHHVDHDHASFSEGVSRRSTNTMGVAEDALFSDGAARRPTNLLGLPAGASMWESECDENGPQPSPSDPLETPIVSPFATPRQSVAPPPRQSGLRSSLLHTPGRESARLSVGFQNVASFDTSNAKDMRGSIDSSADFGMDMSPQVSWRRSSQDEASREAASLLQLGAPAQAQARQGSSAPSRRTSQERHLARQMSSSRTSLERQSSTEPHESRRGSKSPRQLGRQSTRQSMASGGSRRSTLNQRKSTTSRRSTIMDAPKMDKAAARRSNRQSHTAASAVKATAALKAEMRTREACESLRFLVFGYHDEDKRTNGAFYDQACGTKVEVMQLHKIWIQMDEDGSGDVEFQEFLSFFSKSKADRLMGMRCVKYLVGSGMCDTGEDNQPMGCRIEDMMRLIWLKAQSTDIEAMMHWFSEAEFKRDRAPTPPLLPKRKRREILENFPMLEEGQAVTFQDLRESGLVEERTIKDLEDSSGGRGVTEGTILEMLCPNGYRALKEAKAASDSEGRPLEYVSNMYFTGWIYKRCTTDAKDE